MTSVPKIGDQVTDGDFVGEVEAVARDWVTVRRWASQRLGASYEHIVIAIKDVEVEI